MNPRARFMNAFTDAVPDRPPCWIMRQAGRYLPEYRALKERHDFLTLVKTPELAAEATLQPLRRFPQLDAAIIFSDILIVPEAMGLPYAFRDSGGIEMGGAIRSRRDIEALAPGAVRARTAYLAEALRLVRRALGDHRALLGFGGAPWTLATYMVEGGSTRDFARTRALFEEEPALFAALMEKLTAGLVDLFRSQAEAGADAVQIFDSWAAAAQPGRYGEASLQWIARIIEQLPPGLPVILFARGMPGPLEDMVRTGARALAVDHAVDLPALRRQAPATLTLQGNLDPEWLTGEPAPAVAATRALLEAMQPWRRYIFNLGHGITPQARIDTLAAILDCIAGPGGNNAPLSA